MMIDTTVKIKKFIIVWLIISSIFWLVYSIFAEYTPIVFAPLWLGLVGAPIYLKRKIIEVRLKKWKAKGLVKFSLIAYLMVLIEEVFAGIANHLLEDFSWLVMMERILQFQFFNIFAFTGLIFGMYISAKIFKYSRREMLLLAGFWGLFAENVIMQLFNNVLYVMFTFIPIIVIYGFIIYPSLLSIKLPSEGKNVNVVFKYAVSLLLIYAMSIVPMILAGFFKVNYSFLFPPSTMISM